MNWLIRSPRGEPKPGIAIAYAKVGHQLNGMKQIRFSDAILAKQRNQRLAQAHASISARTKIPDFKRL